MNTLKEQTYDLRKYQKMGKVEWKYDTKKKEE